MMNFGQRVKKMWENIYEIKKKKDEKQGGLHKS